MKMLNEFYYPFYKIREPMEESIERDVEFSNFLHMEKYTILCLGLFMIFSGK